MLLPVDAVFVERIVVTSARSKSALRVKKSANSPMTAGNEFLEKAYT